ncbi:MAG: S-adenosylmethionine decarboxylase [Gemmatimonadales bacterium]
MSLTFVHHHTELTALGAPRLGDANALAGLVIAAASAVGLQGHGPPVAKSGPRGVAVVLVGHGGHLALHTIPEEGRAVIDLVAPAPADPKRAVEIILRRLMK